MTRICTKCKVEKGAKHFHKDLRRKSGLRVHCKTCASLYFFQNKETIKSKQVRYKSENFEKIKHYNAEYYKINKRHHNELVSTRSRERYATDINFKMRVVLRSRLNCALKNDQKCGSAIADLGCTVKQLKKHIESKFQFGMTWKNWNRTGWHIDHIVPLSSFDLTNEEEFKKAVHYTNLAPLWAADNLSKNAKVGAI